VADKITPATAYALAGVGRSSFTAANQQLFAKLGAALLVLDL